MATQKKKTAPKPQGRKKKAPTTRSGDPQIAAKAREIEQKKAIKNYKEPKPVGANFRKFSQIIVVVMVLAGLLLSGLGSISSLRGTDPEPVDTSNNLTGVDGTPLNGIPVDTSGPEWSEVDGLITDPVQPAPEDVPVEGIPVEPTK